MLHCPPVSFNVTTTAGYYSQLAGVLAGFAFTALMFLAATRVSSPERGHAFADAIRILVAAFISLVLTSLDYAIFAGQAGSSNKLITSGEPIVGVGFAISGALVIYAIILTLDAANRLVRLPSVTLPRVGTSTRHLLAVIIAPLLLYYILQAVQQDYEVARYGECHRAVPLDYLGPSLLYAQLAVSLIGYPLLLRYGCRARSPEVVSHCAIWVSRLLLAVSFGSAVAFALVGAQLRRPEQIVPPIVPGICLVIMFLAMSGMTWQIAYTSPPSRRRTHTTTRVADWQELEHWHISEVEPRLLRRIRRDFPGPQTAEVLQLLSTLDGGSASSPGAEILAIASFLHLLPEYISTG